MNILSREFELLLGHAAFKLWPDLPRDMQEKLFEAVVPNNPLLGYSFAAFLHDHHPRTAHPPKWSAAKNGYSADKAASNTRADRRALTSEALLFHHRPADPKSVQPTHSQVWLPLAKRTRA